MTTLSGQTILIVGGSSGIGFGVAKASLQSLASHVIIASSTPEKVSNAVDRLHAVLSASKASGIALPGVVSGEVVDAKDGASVKDLVARVGEVDHLVWTSGDPLRLGFQGVDLDKNRDMFDIRFWGPVIAAQNAKIRKGGSITLTVGSVIVKPRTGWSLAAGMMGAVDSVTRGLAVDLAPVRVNVISPGYVRTELWDPIPEALREKMLSEAGAALLVKHVAEPEEIAEAYLFVMNCVQCQFVTGQRIEVDGGYKLL